MAVLENIRDLARRAGSSFTDAESQQQDKSQALMEARRAEEAARRESAIKQQAASQATERQSVLPPDPKSTVEHAQEVLSARQPEQDPMMMPEREPAPNPAPNTESVAFPKFPKSTSASAERIRQSRIKSASTEQALKMSDAGLGDASVGGPQLKSVTDKKPDDLPTSEGARKDAADAMQEQDEQSALVEKQTAAAKGGALEEAYGNFLQSLQASGQENMLEYYMNPEPMSYDEDTGTWVPDPNGKTGKQLFIEDVLESDQNSPEEQQAAMGNISRAQDRRFANKVSDFNENDPNDRPGSDRIMKNDSQGTREFERRLNQENIPEKLRDPDKNMVPTNMFDPETGEPGIAGQSPTMVGEGRPERSGASAAYGPPGTDWKRRGMEMGDQHGPNGSGDGDANYMLSLMTEENWNGLRDQDRRDLVMNLANRLGYLDGIKNLPEEDQYYEAKRAVFSHIFQTGDGAQRIWANNEAELGENSDLIDPNKKPMLVNEWDDNRQQWVLNQSQDSRERGRMRAATAFASRGMKGHSKIDQYMNPDGTMNEDAAEAKMMEVINAERVNMGQEPTDVDSLTPNEQLALKHGMRLLYDMPQHAKVKQNNMDQGAGQVAMGHAGNSIQWRQLGAYNREIEGAETLEEKAAIARKYNNVSDMNMFNSGALNEADRDAATQAAALEKDERDEDVRTALSETAADRQKDIDVAKINAKTGEETSPGYIDQLRASEGDPVMMQYAHEEELKKQLESMADENGTVTWSQMRQNNAAISVLNNMYLDPKMGRSWTEWWNDEEMGDVQKKKFVVGQKAYADSVLDMLGLNVPGREEEYKEAREWAMKNYIDKFRAVNPMGANALRLDADPTPPAQGQAQAQGQGQAQSQGQGQAQSGGQAATSQNVSQTVADTTNGKTVQGPQDDILPESPDMMDLEGLGNILKGVGNAATAVRTLPRRAGF